MGIPPGSRGIGGAAAFRSNQASRSGADRCRVCPRAVVSGLIVDTYITAASFEEQSRRRRRTSCSVWAKARAQVQRREIIPGVENTSPHPRHQRHPLPATTV